LGIGDTFKTFVGNLAVDNGDTISVRYGELTRALNQDFRQTDSRTANNLQVGSYGRWTAIKGISDLDMLYIVPASLWETYRDGGQSRLLTRACDAMKARYPNTKIYVDRLVVRVLYQNFHIEVQPVFAEDDGGYTYPDTYKGGSWKYTNPRAEIRAMSEFDQQKNKNLRRLCKMARAWKNRHGMGMGGLLIDTLAHNFLKSTSIYDDKSYLYYDVMSRDFFKYLSDLPKQDYFMALGSGQRVKVKQNFQKSAGKAYDLCVKAIAAEGTDSQNDKWRKVFGRQFPSAEAKAETASVLKEDFSFTDTEQFFEDFFPVDVRYPIRLECEVTQDGFRPHSLREFLAKAFRLKREKTLRFFVERHQIPGDFDLHWKVLNRGYEARKRDCIRGQIFEDGGNLQNTETTDFYGDHIVECAAVQNGVIVARNRIKVPIE